MNCPKCGVANTAGGSFASQQVRFCFNCGADLNAVDERTVETPLKIAEPDSLSLSATANANSQTIIADPLVGKVLDGKYRIDELLNAGGMGKVYRGVRLHIGDTVAIKILHGEGALDIQAAERFRREAQATSRLKHPNAVSIYDFGVSMEGVAYLVMELAEGKSLRSIVKRQGSLSGMTSSEIISQVCDALDEAHRQDIIHRDIKPDNIIVNLTSNGVRVKVLDFGIAKLHDLSAEMGQLTLPGRVMGTPQYMSPEQCMDEELDGRSDIYSLGVVLFEILTGRVPFAATTTTALAVQHVNQSPPRPSSISPNISPSVERVLLRALAKKKDDRPQTALAFANELEAAVRAFETVPAPASGTIKREELRETIMAPPTPHAGIGGIQSAPSNSFPSSINTSSFPSRIDTPAFLKPSEKTSSVATFLIVFLGGLVVILLAVLIFILVHNS